jgi:hypothetical protein
MFRHLLTLAAFLLVVAGPQAAAAKSPPKQPAKPQAALVEALGADDFAAREKAEADLAKWAADHPQDACERFWELSRQATDPEVRDRCLSLLRRQVLRERDAEGMGFIGISMQAVLVTPPGADEQPAVRVIDIIPLSGAVNSDLKIGDQILKFDGRKLTGQVPNALGMQDDDAVGFRLSEWVRQRKPGETVVLTVLRGVDQLDVKVTLGLYRQTLQNGLLDPSSYEERIRREDDQFFESWLEAKRSAKE